MISTDVKNQVLKDVHIEEVISDFLTLKKRGNSLIGICPFHSERTPSFTVNPSKGFYKCFGCGASGDAVQFIIEHESFTFPEAIRYLANKYNVPLQDDSSTEEYSHRDNLFSVTTFAQNFYQDYLRSNNEGLQYLINRGFTDETIKKFSLGLAPDRWDGLITSSNHSQELLEKSGLIINNENKVYDRFRDRIIFPIHNLTGRTVAFGARILKTDTKTPKYLNSPETEIYSKSKNLYGIYQAKRAISTHDSCFLVEGYTDVLSLHQAGIKNVVASSGTALTIEQIKLIGRYTKNITILYDGDPAGIKASLRGIDLILEEGMNVRVVLFPDGEDPDSYAKHVTTEELETFLNTQSVDFITFKTNLLLSDAGKDPIKKLALIRDIVESISKIPDEIDRISYIQHSAKLIKVSQAIILEGVKKLLTIHEAVPVQSQEPDTESFFNIVKDTPILNRTKYLLFLQSKGIFQYRINKEGATILIIIRDNIVERIDKVDIGIIIKDHLSSNPFFYEAFLRGADSYLSDSLLRFLEVKTIHWNKDKRDTSWLYFSNTAVLCSKNNPKCIPYSEIPNFIWKSQILPREFTYLDNTTDYEDSTFPRFISAITGGDTDKNIALITVIGFLLHAFRDPTKPSAILLTDEILSDNPQGGTGKGIFTKALQYFRIHQDYDGKSFSFDRNFLWQGISFDTQIVVIDDIPKSFPFERLFSVLTNGIQVENKNSKTFYIPFQDSPKFIISANSAIKGEGNSHERRKLEIEFSNFFHRDNTPKDYFGHQFFDDWNSEQWIQFDNYMITCLQIYFQKGLIYPKSINIELKKLHANTSSEFIEWAETNIYPEMMIPKREFYDRFISDCPNQKRFTSSVRFYSFVESYASFYKLNIKSTKLNGVHIFRFDK